MLVSSNRAIVRTHGMSPAGAASLRLIPPRSPQWVVVWVLRSVLDPDWEPASSAAELVERTSDPVVLRRAQARLRTVARHRGTVRHARAIATLDVALELVAGQGEDGQGEHGRGEDGRGEDGRGTRR